MGKLTLLLLALLALSTVSARLVLPNEANTEGTYIENMFEYFKFQNKLQVDTSCAVVNIPEYDGVIRSGYLNVGVKNSNSALSFIFYGALGAAAEDLKHIPTVIWLNGGPGCSSQFGNFYELGPLHVNQTSSGSFYFTPNPYAWTNEYNVIFVD